MDLVGSILALLLVVTVLRSSLSFLRKYQLKWRVKALGIPEFRGIPLFGNFFQLVRSFNSAPGVPHGVYVIETVKGFQKLLRSPSLLMGSVSSTFYVGVVTPNEVEDLLSSNKELNKSPEYDFTKLWLGAGLATSSPHKWKKQRKHLIPAFHFQILEQFYSTMVFRANTLVHKLKDHVGKPFVHIEPYISNCTLDIIAETALGVSVDAQKDGRSPFAASIEQLTTLLFRRLISPWLWFSVPFYLSPTGWKFRKHYSVVSNFVKKVIREKKARLADATTSVGQEQKGRKAFLDILLLQNEQDKTNQLSEKDIEDEVHTFSFAGHDTTTTVITWTLFLLGLHPDVQLKVQEEIDRVFGDDENVDNVKNLQYLERVIKETMRLYPPLPYIARALMEDLKCGPYVVPKGSTLVVALPVLHRNPTQFPNPEAFDPDRFLETKRHPFAYIPFSAGPRNCIGQRFAMLEVKTVLGILLRNFVFTSLDPRDKVLNSAELISRPSIPIRMKLDLRRTSENS